MTEIDERFAERLRRVRRFRGLSLEDVGQATGMALNTVSKIERGNRRVTIGEAVAFAAALGVPLADLISDGPLAVTVTV